MDTHDIRVHYMDGHWTIGNVDPDRYCYMDLLSDACQQALGHTNVNMMLTVHGDVHGIGLYDEIRTDNDLLDLFRAHKGESVIHVFLNASESQPVSAVPPYEDDMGDDEVFDFTDEDEEWIPGSEGVEGHSPNSSSSKLNAESTGEEDSPGDDSNDALSNYQSNDDEGDTSSNSDDGEHAYVDPNKFIRGKKCYSKEGGKVVLHEDQLFVDVNQFRATLNDFIIQEGFDIIRLKNEKRRFRAICASKDCTWSIYASPVLEGGAYMIKKLQPQHSCLQTTKNRNANSTWIAEQFAARLRANPEMKLEGMRRELLEDYGIEVPKMQLYRARRKALEKNEGSYAKSYSKLRMYAENIIDKNPGSVVKLQCERVSRGVNPAFKRIFVCYDAMKTGFVQGCRPFLGLDGCHMKGPFGGAMLTAVAVDGNNGIYPFAFGIVESENKESWGFFLEQLHSILGRLHMTFMTYRQKGVVDAINAYFPDASHRCCARHLYNNFKAKFPGVLIRNQFWNAARAYNIQDFKEAMEGMKAFKPAAYDWLIKVPASMWSRHAFDPRVKNHHITNNMTESFNSKLGKLREKPVLAMLEGFRSSLMKRFHKRYEKATTWGNLVTPKIYKKLDKTQQDARKLSVMYAGGDEYEVLDGTHRLVVRLQMRTCNCGEWEISGIPCKHAAACIVFNRGNIMAYCDDCYSVATYLRAHGGMIHPIPDEKYWPPSTCELLDPPPLRRLPGRPKKNRRREPDEDATSRKRSSTVKCCICLQYGHNKRTCQKAPVKERGCTLGGLSERGRGRAGPSERGRGRAGPSDSSSQSSFQCSGPSQPSFQVVGRGRGIGSGTSVNETRVLWM